MQWFLRSGEMVLRQCCVYCDALKKAEATLRENFPKVIPGAGQGRSETTRKYAQQIVEYFDLTKVTYWDEETYMACLLICHKFERRRACKIPILGGIGERITKLSCANT